MYLERVKVETYKLIGVEGYDVAELFNESLNDAERQEFLNNVGAEKLIKCLLNHHTRDELIGMVKELDDDENIFGDEDNLD